MPNMLLRLLADGDTPLRKHSLKQKSLRRVRAALHCGGWALECRLVVYSEGSGVQIQAQACKGLRAHPFLLAYP
jgi:hypothetical protein